MTSSEDQTTASTTDDEIHQIPITIQPPGDAETRDVLLRAISRETQFVTDKLQGHASKALEELARAFALVSATVPTSGASPTVGMSGRSATYDVRNTEGSVHAYVEGGPASLY
ncbi:hypothetical protein HLB23_36285 [Nocardia uniformis]|uniref:Uncharacterized protein n=1 Tax=Nocardia uniformis TaxID=53432 RepID=A0A849CK42_9NOCA|nr:hypothetical protein [Nocardia uniformis]NNH75251.1 hypothetical protein [Nocardia uniformis]